MAIEKVSFGNVKQAIEAKDSVTSIPMEIGVAYEDSVAADKNLNDITDKLEKNAKEIATESPDTPKVKAKNIYTKEARLLDESVEDFNLSTADLDKRVFTKDEIAMEKEDYLDYDMFDFVYGIVAAEEWPRPKNPLGRPIRQKFQYMGSDNYSDNVNAGVPQITTDEHSNVVVYADSVEDFKDTMDICDYYKIPYEAPKPKRSNSSRWNFSLTILVPKTSDGYPMMVEDFFEPQGLTMSDVIENHMSSGKVANWGTTYEKEAKKDRNDIDVQRIYDAYVVKAARSNDPLDDFIDAMFAEMDSEGLKYSKSKLKKDFIKKFDDDFED